MDRENTLWESENRIQQKEIRERAFYDNEFHRMRFKMGGTLEEVMIRKVQGEDMIGSS